MIENLFLTQFDKMKPQEKKGFRLNLSCLITLSLNLYKIYSYFSATEQAIASLNLYGSP
jgi:hypothetical protein